MKHLVFVLIISGLLFCCEKSGNSNEKRTEIDSNQTKLTQINRRNTFIESPFGMGLPFTDDVLEKTFGTFLLYDEMLGQEAPGKDSFENIKKYEYDGLSITLRSNGLFDVGNTYFTFVITKNNYSLKEGLRIGSAKNEVIGVLGQPDLDNGKMMEYKNREVWYTVYFYYEDQIITRMLWNRDL